MVLVLIGTVIKASLSHAVSISGQPDMLIHPRIPYANYSRVTLFHAGFPVRKKKPLLSGADLFNFPFLPYPVFLILCQVPTINLSQNSTSSLNSGLTTSTLFSKPASNPSLPTSSPWVNTTFFTPLIASTHSNN